MPPTPQLSQEEQAAQRKAVAVDLALRLRRGQVKLKDIPKDLLPTVHGVSEREILRRAVQTSAVKRFGHFNRPPAQRQRPH